MTSINITCVDGDFCLEAHDGDRRLTIYVNADGSIDSFVSDKGAQRDVTMFEGLK